MRAALTLTGFRRLTPLRINSNANINKPKKNTKKIWSLATMSTMTDTLLPAGELFLVSGVILHPDKDNQLLEGCNLTNKLKQIMGISDSYKFIYPTEIHIFLLSPATPNRLVSQCSLFLRTVGKRNRYQYLPVLFLGKFVQSYGLILLADALINSRSASLT